MTVDDLFFKPSLDLDMHQYSVFLSYASAKELEEDLLFKNTYWEIVKHFDIHQEEFNVWFDGSVAVTQPPPEPPKPPKPLPVGEYNYECDEYCDRYGGLRF